MSKEQNDFSQGSILKHLVSLAVPMTIAQLVQLLYNIVDRVYIGHLPGASSLALTGLGLTFPIITIIMAFTNLFGMGGAPLCSIARGKGEQQRAEKLMGNTFTALCGSAIVLMAVCYLFMEPLLYLFGASNASYPYAAQYLNIYLLGTPFVMLSSGMNGFINSQGFGRAGMATILVGAIANILLDPLFIFGLHMGVAGAAVATVISQGLSALWVMSFLLGKRTVLKMNKEAVRPDKKIIREIAVLGTAGFVMQASGSAVQIACNTTLKANGGDVYVGIMTVLNSVRDMVLLPMHGLTNAAQPIIGYNYGAKAYGRIKQAIGIMTTGSVVYTLAAWLVILMFPEQLIRIFNADPELLAKGVPAMHVYFAGFFMMALQAAGQSVFVGLGQPKQAICFSMLRKIVIVVPLTLLLPHVAGLGVTGVFLAEPISNFVGGTACFTTMLLLTKKLLRTREGAAPLKK